MQAIWNPEPDSRNSLEAHMPISPFFDMKPLSIQHSLVPHTVDTKPQTWTSLSSAMNADSIIANDDDSGSDGSDEEDEELFQGVNLESLKSRGKGLHYCPKRYNCTKGGVDENNKLVAFVRNSAYL